jgi:flagellar protein FliO/FliZ
VDVLTFLRTVAALGTVLGLLVGALCAVKRYNIALPGQTGARTSRRLALVERVGIDAKRSIILVRRDDREHLIMVAPDGQTVIETDIPCEVPAASPVEAAGEAPAAKLHQDLARLIAVAGATGARAKAAITQAGKAALDRTGNAGLATDDKAVMARVEKAVRARTDAETPSALVPSRRFADLVSVADDTAEVTSGRTRPARLRKVKATPVVEAAPAARPTAARKTSTATHSKPKRPPVLLKVTAPDGRTVVEPISARAGIAAAQAA